MWWASGQLWVKTATDWDPNCVGIAKCRFQSVNRFTIGLCARLSDWIECFKILPFCLMPPSRGIGCHTWKTSRSGRNRISPIQLGRWSPRPDRPKREHTEQTRSLISNLRAMNVKPSTRSVLRITRKRNIVHWFRSTWRKHSIYEEYWTEVGRSMKWKILNCTEQVQATFFFLTRAEIEFL